jgi:guanylate kinase
MIFGKIKHMDTRKGKLILVVGPTGSGKGTLVEHIEKTYPDISYSISCTTRQMRPNEVEGKDYYFLSKEEFKQRIAAGDFLEWARYGGNYYGTPKAEVESRLSRGEIVLLEIEVQGARQVKKIIPSGQLAILFIDAGPWEELESRVRARAPITDAELQKRKERYEDESSFKKEATHVIKNPTGKLETAKQDLDRVIDSLLVS